jgi:hypothetical protein
MTRITGTPTTDYLKSEGRQGPMARVQHVVVLLRLDDLSVAHDEQDLHLRDVIPAVRAAGGPVPARDPKGPLRIDTVESLRRLAARQILGLPQPGIARELSH